MTAILTLTMNPALDIIYRLDELYPHQVNKVRDKWEHPGGKGINVSKALAALGQESLCWTLLGGTAGDHFLDLLRPQPFAVRSVRIDGPTRQNIKLKVGSNHYEINEPGPRITPAEIRRFEDKLFPDFAAAKVLVLAGSLPLGVPDSYYARLIEIGADMGLKVVLDTSGPPLRQGLAAGPLLVKPNRAELEELLGLRLAETEAVISAARRVVAMGAKNVLVSLGAQGAVLVNAQGAWESQAPQVKLVSPLGAGDSMVASCAASLAAAEYTDSHMLQIATAAGTAAVEQPGSRGPEWKRIKELVSEVVIKRWN